MGSARHRLSRSDALIVQRRNDDVTIAADLQSDQQAARWDDHVVLYQEVFEPLSLAFARQAIAGLDLRSGERVLDVAAGAGGAARAMAEAGARVAAIDGSPGMIDRICRRAEAAHVGIDARVMDGQALEYPDGAFDAALSVFGVILFPDAAKGLAEMRRVVRPGGRIAVVTWTQPHRYELATNLREAILALGPEAAAPAALPAQLRFVDPEAFRGLFAAAGLRDVEIETAEAHLQLPSTRWLADRIHFAPGMEAWVLSLGERRAAALEAFAARLEDAQGLGPTKFGAVASIGLARVPWGR
jgi:ubiquinone/menaquinone biosynthesis C-methylase UbiE